MQMILALRAPGSHSLIGDFDNDDKARLPLYQGREVASSRALDPIPLPVVRDRTILDLRRPFPNPNAICDFAAAPSSKGGVA